VVLVLPRRAGRRPRGDEEKAQAEAEEDDDHYDDDRHDGDDDYDAGEDDAPASALAIDSTSHSGTRVGRSVRASTVAWRVQPSAIRSPSRSTRYS
jgi:hypothetical protein